MRSYRFPRLSPCCGTVAPGYHLNYVENRLEYAENRLAGCYAIAPPYCLLTHPSRPALRQQTPDLLCLWEAALTFG
jgi:hypothetical protein